ncbi:MAG: cytochrome C [Deltaproteobacteria bacterium]|nr:cytochrome C [Deltaproteobacteria bacterium]
MRQRFRLAGVLAFSSLALVSASGEALAIAAFSREYNTECSTCHNPYPHRNEFGEAFRLNGYVWPGRKPNEVPAGAEALWAAGLPRTLPVSVTLQAQLAYDPEVEDDHLDPSTDAFLHVGGVIRDQIGFFAHDLLGSGSGEMFGILRRALGTPVNVKYGKFTPQTTLGKESQSYTLTVPAPLAFTVPGGSGPLAAPRNALEVNAVLGSRLLVAAGAADRNQQDAMDYYGHISWKIGGTDLEGREPDLDLDRESVWDFLTLTLGAYGYLGRIEQPNDTRYRRVGVEGQAQYRWFTALVSTAFAHDQNVDAAGLDVDSVVLAAELDWFLAPRYLLSARFENEDVGNAAQGITKRVIGGVAWYPIENTSVRLEGRWVRTQAEEDPSGVTGVLQIQLHL